MGIKFQAALVTDMPVQELARIFGPIYRWQGIYVTRHAYTSPEHLKALVGTAQARAERANKDFGANIIPAGTKPSRRRKQYVVEGPLKCVVDYGQPQPAGTTMPQKETSFYDRLAKHKD